MELNEFNQPVGNDLTDWVPAKQPDKISIDGQFCHLERLDVDHHVKELYEAFQDSPDARHWTYLPYGPFDTCEDYRNFLYGMADLPDPYHFAIIDNSTNKAVGTIALMRIDCANGVIEVGHLAYSPRMQRTKISTEVMALMFNYVFEELGYRRLEWKCNSLNAPSRAAAERFGFTFEGIFRQAQVSQGRNRDTAWYSMLDKEYASFRSAYDTWLSAENFDELGIQKQKLANLIFKLK
ncbi:GNAT family protein [Cellvibrio sp. NN19]|uniref:GNAT family N-acetyltransferase n=1 Tax=Cellvibrio chitinivorans TaxID=3102792 RepID=UPI002B4138C3|nr:GNAT family protein [Cellvibrio sp. NN19]